jgi:8-oxo-dGTP diphosphatase
VGLSRIVRSAGGVVWRPAAHGVEVLLIHRSRHRDWSFPKGKAKKGETDEDCAVREVEEETGLRCPLGIQLAGTSYRDAEGRTKQVRYWAMELPVGADAAAGDGVDEWVWLPPEEAEERLTWEHDRAVLRSLPVPA